MVGRARPISTINEGVEMASTRKGFVWAALVLALALVAAACSDDGGDTSEPGGSGSAGGEGSIWVLLPDTESSTRWEKDDFVYFTENFEAAGLTADEDFTIVNAERDAT